MKKIILICSLVVLGTGATLSNQFSDQVDLKPATINVPEHMHTLGKWPTPLDVEPFEDTEIFWTIINNTDCTIETRMWFDGYTATLVQLGSNFIYASINSGGNSTITFGALRGLWTATPKTIEFSALQFKIAGGANYIDSYPGTRFYQTGALAPCDCVSITHDYLTRTITIDPC